MHVKYLNCDHVQRRRALKTGLLWVCVKKEGAQNLFFLNSVCSHMLLQLHLNIKACIACLALERHIVLEYGQVKSVHVKCLNVGVCREGGRSKLDYGCV